MIRSTQQAQEVVPPEEVAQRIAEYRRLGFEHQSPVHMVYPPAQHECPWPGCEHRISSIAFELERMGDAEQRTRWLRAWWQGPGLVGRCPGCGKLVLFGMFDKKTVIETAGLEDSLLPEEWFRITHVAPTTQPNKDVGR